MKRILDRLLRKDTADIKNKARSSPGFLKKEHSSLFYLFYFFIVVGICIGMAIIIRFFFLISKSTFLTASYSVLVVSQTPFIVALDKTSPKLSIVTLPSKRQKNRVKESLLLGIPIDGEILAFNQRISKDSFPDTMLLMSMIFQSWLYSYEDMTIIDGVRLIVSSFSVSQKNESHYTIKFSKNGDIEGITSTQLYEIFKDPVIINEQVSIEIINATSMKGLAGSVGRVLKNIGCNIVSITSADAKNTSRIVTNNSSVTLNRVSHILGISSKIEPGYHGVADMQIILGQDFGDKIK